jgi:hypothetical protein
MKLALIDKVGFYMYIKVDLHRKSWRDEVFEPRTPIFRQLFQQKYLNNHNIDRRPSPAHGDIAEDARPPWLADARVRVLAAVAVDAARQLLADVAVPPRPAQVASL